MRRGRRTGNSLAGRVFRLTSLYSVRRQRGRRRTKLNGIFWLALVIGGIYLATEIVRSSLGVMLAVGCFAAAILYGHIAAKGEAEKERRWHDLSLLRSFSGEEFERHVAETYRKNGYRVELTKATADQGADVVASKGAQRIAVQCKQWAGMVGNDAVQQALSGKLFYGCNEAVVVCTSEFTPAAKELARRAGVTIINGREYVEFAATTATRGSRAKASAKWFPSGKPLIIQGSLFALGSAVMVAHFALNASPDLPGVSDPAVRSVSQPVAAQVTSAPSPAIPTPAQNEAKTMVVGNTGNEGVYLRRTPHMDDKLRAWSDGTAMKVLGPSVMSDGQTWKRVEAPDGTEGYVPEQFLIEPGSSVVQGAKPSTQIAGDSAAVLPATPSLPSQQSVPSANPGDTVAQFYAFLQQRQYKQAYSLLSSRFQGQAPYDQWAAGYDTTEAINVEYISPGPAPNSVGVSLIAVDRFPTGEVTRRFAGEWYLVWESGGWRQDQGVLREVP